jgi:hypothetical protein
VNASPTISESTFWDIDILSLDYDACPEWVIERVFDRGSLDEVLSVVRYYGNERVKAHLTSTISFLPNHTILLAKAIFNLSFSDFKCLEKKPFLQRY